MILEIEKIEIWTGRKYEEVAFVKGTTQFESNSQPTSQGMLYECKFRFVSLKSNTVTVHRLSNISQYKITYVDGVILIGSSEFPAKVQLENVEPAVFIVNHQSLTPYI